MRTLGIVPARGGSKGIPRKNVRLLAGKPLLQYTAESAKSSKLLSKILLSTDDLEIAELGENYGLWVPFIRPPHLAQDNTPTLEVILSIINWLVENEDFYDAYCLLQPTSPFRKGTDIDEVIQLLESANADSVVSVSPVPHQYNADWQLKISDTNTLSLWCGGPLKNIIPRRQSLSPSYIRNGAIYAFRHTTITNQNSLYGDCCLPYIMKSNFNLDTLNDWIEAENYINQLGKL